MKKTILFFTFLSLTSILLQAQTVDFFKWNAVNHPFNKPTTVSDLIPANRDNQFNIWKAFTYSLPKRQIGLTNGKDTLISPTAPFKDSVYSYFFNKVCVDGSGGKIVDVNFTYYNSHYYQTTAGYLLLCDSANHFSYLYPQDIGTEFYYDFNRIGKYPLVICGNGISWGPAPTIRFSHDSLGTGSGSKIFTNKKNTLFTITPKNNLYTIASFHADGSYSKRLSGEEIFSYNFDLADSSVIAYTKTGIFKLKEKNQSKLDIPEYVKIIAGQGVQSFNEKRGFYSVQGLLSETGLLVQEGLNYKTFIFGEHAEIGNDSLYTSAAWQAPTYFLQDDSSLVFVLKNNSGNFDTLSMISYKNGNLSLNQKIEIPSINNLLGFYWNGKQSYLFSELYTGTESMNEYIDGKLVNNISFKPAGCSFQMKGSKMICESKYTWMLSGVYDSLYQTNNCDIARFEYGEMITAVLNASTTLREPIYLDSEYLVVSDQMSSVTLCDELGRIVLETAQKRIPTNQLRGGMYIVHTTDPGNASLVKKIFIPK